MGPGELDGSLWIGQCMNGVSTSSQHLLDKLADGLPVFDEQDGLRPLRRRPGEVPLAFSAITSVRGR